MGSLFDKGGDTIEVQQPDPNAIIAAQQAANQFSILSPSGDALLGDVDAQGAFTPQAGSAVQINETPAQNQLREQQEQIAAAMGDLAAQRTGQLPNTPLSFEGLPPIPAGINFGALPGVNPLSFQGLPPIQSQLNLGGLPGVNTLQPDQLPGVAPLDLGELPELSRDQNALRSRVEGELFDRSFSLLDPIRRQEQQRLETGLRSQGIPLTAQAGLTARDRLGRQQGEQLDRLAQSSVAQGGAEASRQFGLEQARRQQEIGERLTGRGAAVEDRERGLREALAQIGVQQQARGTSLQEQLQQIATGADARRQGIGERQSLFAAQGADRARTLGEGLTQADLQRQARQQGISEAQALRTSQFAELSALLGGAPTFPVPQFGQPGGVDVTGAFGLAQNATNAAIAQQQAQQESANLGLGSLLGAAGTIGGGLLGGPFGAFLGGSIFG